MAIRYDDALKKEIQRTVNNFNAKLRRLDEEQRAAIEPLRVRKIKQSFTDRGDLERFLKIHQKFGKRKAETILFSDYDEQPVTKWEVATAEQRRTLAMHRLRSQIEEVEKEVFTRYGTPTKTSLMGGEYHNTLKSRLESLQNKPRANTMSLSELKRLMAQLSSVEQTDGRIALWQEKYLKQFTIMADRLGIPQEDVDTITKELKKLTPQQFDKLYRTEVGIKNISDNYPKLHKAKTDEDFAKLRALVEYDYQQLAVNIKEVIKDYK